MNAHAKIRVALVGIAGYGDRYLEALLPARDSQKIELMGVVDPYPQRCRRLDELRAGGIPIHSTVEALLDSTELDLLMIASPIHVHRSQTCHALKKKINVLCEKPLAGTLSDAAEMWRAQLVSPKFVAIGYQWSFSAAVQRLKKDILDGVLGKPIRMRALAVFPRSRAYFTRNDWAGRARMPLPTGEFVNDSPLNNATSHYLHNIFYLLGRTQLSSASPSSVQAELYRANDIENFDTAAVRCRSEDGTEILFYTTHVGPDRVGPMSCYEFEKAVVDYDASGPSAGHFVARFKDGTVRDYGRPDQSPHEKIWQCVDAVRTGKPVACGIQAAIPHALCVAAAQESEIIDFPVNLQRRVPSEHSEIICIEGLPEALAASYARGILPSEDGGLDWPRQAATVEFDRPQWSEQRAALSATGA